MEIRVGSYRTTVHIVPASLQLRQQGVIINHDKQKQ